MTLLWTPQDRIGALGAGIRFHAPVMGGLTYLLYDQFLTDRAAGAVNGTSAEPTGGTRTVTDTGSQISISGSSLLIGSGAGSPRISWTEQTRVAGKALIGNISATVNDMYFGFATTIGISTGNLFRIRPGGLNISTFENSVTNALGDLVAGTTYQYAVVLRSTGAYYYVKGGAYTNWTLLWIGSAVSGATNYPLFYQNGGAITADNIRIPTSTWLPTPLAFDSFTRADGAIGSTEADSPDGTTLPAHAAPVLAWTNQVGTVEVASNKAVATALSGGRAICTFPSASADVLHSAAFIRGTTGVGIVLRYVDANNYVYAKRVATNVVIIKNISGSETTLATVAATEVSSAVLLGIFYGTKLRTYYNNALLGSELTISDAAIQSEDQMGLIFFDTDSTADLVTTFDRDGYEFLDTV